MKPAVLFLTAVRMMNFNITILAANIHGSVVVICLAAIIVIVSIPLPVDADDAPR